MNNHKLARWSRSFSLLTQLSDREQFAFKVWRETTHKCGVILYLQISFPGKTKTLNSETNFSLFAYLYICLVRIRILVSLFLSLPTYTCISNCYWTESSRGKYFWGTFSPFPTSPIAVISIPTISLLLKSCNQTSFWRAVYFFDCSNSPCLIQWRNK